jgi:hypothetical protein
MLTDNVGNFRTSYTAEELAAFTEQQRPQAQAIAKQAAQVEKLEQQIAKNDIEIGKLARLLDASETAYRASKPSWDRLAELKRMSENARRQAMGEPPLPPLVLEGDAELKRTMDKTESALASANERSRVLRDQLKEMQSKLADLVKEWQSANKPNPRQVYLDHIARLAEHDRKIEAGEIARPDETVRHMSALDSQMHRAKTSVNIGYGRKHQKKFSGR